eukprot:scaffold25703_cov140-Isochrysis_galbana.AAC.2
MGLGEVHAGFLANRRSECLDGLYFYCAVRVARPPLLLISASFPLASPSHMPPSLLRFRARLHCLSARTQHVDSRASRAKAANARKSHACRASSAARARIERSTYHDKRYTASW